MTDVFYPLDEQLAALRHHIATARRLCYTGRPVEDPPMGTRHERPEAHDPTPCAVHVKRADGLDLEVSGSAAFVTAMLKDVLEVLGVIPPPPA